MELREKGAQKFEGVIAPSFSNLQTQISNRVQLVTNDDIELLFLDLLDEILPEPLEIGEFGNEGGKIIKYNFGKLGSYKLNIKFNIISIEMIQMPKKGVEAMLSIIKYAYENGISKIKGEANPQKKYSSDMERRLKLLVSFYTSFGFTPGMYSGTGGQYMMMDLSEKGLLEILYKRTRIFKETGKWPVLYIK